MKQEIDVSMAKYNLSQLDYRIDRVGGDVKLTAVIAGEDVGNLNRDLEILGLNNGSEAKLEHPDGYAPFAYISIKGQDDLEIALEHGVFSDELAGIVEQSIDAVYGNEQSLSGDFDCTVLHHPV